MPFGVKGESYRRLQKMLRWCEGAQGMFWQPFHDDPLCSTTAERAMLDWDGAGLPLPTTVNGADRLSAYVQGKRSRDWHVSEWKRGIREGLFSPYEFVGSFGLTETEVRKLLL